jgi:WD40 repeat protein
MPDDSVVLGQLAEEFTARVRAGELPEVEDYARRHPALAERIRGLFPTLLFLEGAAAGRPRPGGGEAATVAPAAGTAGLTPGQTFNHYRIERELGRGGMGIVYEAVHLPLGKRVALKVLPLFAAEGVGSLERFLREAQTAAALHHTNIVPVFDIGQAVGLPYYAMQYIDGRGLDRVLEEMQAADPGPAAQALVAAGRSRSPEFYRRVAELGIQAAEGLAHAHQRGVIHRDIKPSNLLLDDRGVLWITDFGLARRGADPALTQTGALVGTPKYMSPEQAEAARRAVDHRTDVYSLGATLYELVTRRPPFTGATPVDVLVQVLEREPAAPRRLDPAVPRDLETVILKAMAKRPPDRYQTAQDLADDLRRWLALEPIRARRIGPVGRTVRWCRRNPALAGLAACLLLVAAAGFALVTWQWRRAEEQRRGEEAAREAAQGHLARGLYEQARTLLASPGMGRRHRTLELLAEAARLCDRVRRAEGAGPEAQARLPAPLELRNLAVQALLTRDASVVCEWRGIPVAITPDNRWAALAKVQMEGKALLWVVDLTEDGRKSFGPWEVSLDQFEALALSPDGQWLAVSEKGRPGVSLWHVPSGKREPLPGPPAPAGAAPAKEKGPVVCKGLAFSPDGSQLAATSSAGKSRKQILVWDLTARAVPRVLVAQADVFGDQVAFSPGGQWLAYSSSKGMTVLDLKQPGEPVTLPFLPPVHSWDYQAFALAPDNRLLAAGYGHGGPKKGTILLWDLVAQAGPREIQTDVDMPRLAFSSDSRRLAAQDSRGTIRFFRVADGREEWRQTMAELGDSDLLRWHTDGRRLFSTAGTHALVLWEPAWDRPAAPLATEVSRPLCLAFSPDGEWLAVGTAQSKGPIRLIHRASGRVRELPVPYSPRQLVFRPDGRQLGVVGGQQALVLDVASGKEVARLKPPAGSPSPYAGAFNADGRFLVGSLGSAREQAAVWDTTTGRKIWQAPKDTCIASLSADGRFVVTVPAEEWPGILGFITNVTGFRLWDLSANRPLGPLQTGDETFMAPAPTLSPDGRWLFTPVNSFSLRPEGRAYLWSLPAGEKHLALTGTADVSACAFSPDSGLLAVGYEDGSAQVWGLGGEGMLFQWKPHAKEIRLLQFTPDGTTLVSGDGQAPDLEVLDLTGLRRRLAEIGLDW